MSAFCKTLGLSDEVYQAFVDNLVDGKMLNDITDEELINEIGMKPGLQIKRLRRELEALRGGECEGPQHVCVVCGGIYTASCWVATLGGRRDGGCAGAADGHADGARPPLLLELLDDGAADELSRWCCPRAAVPEATVQPHTLERLQPRGLGRRRVRRRRRDARRRRADVRLSALSDVARLSAAERTAVPEQWLAREVPHADAPRQRGLRHQRDLLLPRGDVARAERWAADRLGHELVEAVRRDVVRLRLRVDLELLLDADQDGGDAREGGDGVQRRHLPQQDRERGGGALSTAERRAGWPRVSRARAPPCAVRRRLRCAKPLRCARR